MIHTPIAFPVESGNPQRLTVLQSPEQRCEGYTLALCSDSCCVLRQVRSAPAVHETGNNVVSMNVPEDAEGYAVWSLPTNTSSNSNLLETIALTYYTQRAPGWTSKEDTAPHSHGTPLHYFYVRCSGGEDTLLYAQPDVPLSLEHVEELQQFQLTSDTHVLVVRTIAALYCYRLSSSSLSSPVLLSRLGDGIPIPGGRRGIVLISGHHPLEWSTGPSFQLLVTSLEGNHVHIHLLGFFFEPDLHLRVVSRTGDGRDLVLPCSSAALERWFVDWGAEELVLQIRRPDASDTELARLCFAPPKEAATAAVSSGLLATPSMSSSTAGTAELAWRFSSSLPPYANAATRATLRLSPELLYSSSRLPQRPVWALRPSASPTGDQPVRLLHVKDIGSAKLPEYHLVGPRGTPAWEQETPFSSLVVTYRSGTVWIEELVVVLGSALFRIPGITSSVTDRSGAPADQAPMADTSLCHFVLSQSPRAEVEDWKRQLAAQVLQHLGTGKKQIRGEASLPEVLRDRDFVCRDGAVFHHLVLETLMAAPMKPEPAKVALLRYLSFVDSLHPATVAQSLLFAGDEQGLLLAVATVVGPHTGAAGGADSFARWPEWGSATGAVYSRSVGHPTPNPSGVLILWAHAAALAEAALAALAAGGNGALALLLRVLSTVSSTLYHSTRLVTLPPEKVASLHGAEARVQSALQTLAGYSEWCAYVGSVWGNLTAHLPAPEGFLSARSRLSSTMVRAAAGERRKEVQLGPGTARPIQTRREVDIVPWTP